MALEPPRVGPQQIERDEKPEVPHPHRIAYVNQHLLIIHEFSTRLTELVRQGAIFGKEAIDRISVDGRLKMTEEQFQELRELLTLAVDKALDMHDHMRKIIALATLVSGRIPPPADWPRPHWEPPTEPIVSRGRLS